MKIEVLYIDGCPNHDPAVRRVVSALEDIGITAEVIERAVVDADSAQLVGFLGSPTVRVNGVDVEPSARNQRLFGMTCRTYVEGTKRTGVPPLDLVRTAILEAQSTQH